MADKKDNTPIDPAFRDSNYNNPDAPMAWTDRIKGAMSAVATEKMVSNFGMFGRMYEAKQQGTPLSLREAFKIQIAAQVGQYGTVGSAVAAAGGSYGPNMLGVPPNVARLIDQKVAALDAKVSQKIDRIENRLENESGERKRFEFGVRRDIDKINQSMERLRGQLIRLQQQQAIPAAGVQVNAADAILDRHSAVQSILDRGHRRLLENAPFLRSLGSFGKMLSGTMTTAESGFLASARGMVGKVVGGAAIAGATAYLGYKMMSGSASAQEIEKKKNDEPRKSDGKSTADLTMIDSEKPIIIKSLENIEISTRKDIVIKAREITLDAAKIRLKGGVVMDFGATLQGGSEQPNARGVLPQQQSGGRGSALAPSMPPSQQQQPSIGGMVPPSSSSGGIQRPVNPDDQGASPRSGTYGGPRNSPYSAGTDSSGSSSSSAPYSGPPVSDDAKSAVLAQKRARFFDELEKDPALKEKVLALMMAENGRHPEGILESMMNRMDATGIRSVKTAITNGFYGPINRGEVPSHLPNGDKRNRALAAYDRVRGGSDDIGMRTDQGMVNEHRFADRNPEIGRKARIHGEYYSLGSKKEVDWYNRTQREIMEYERAQREKAAAGTSRSNTEMLRVKKNNDYGKIPFGADLGSEFKYDAAGVQRGIRDEETPMAAPTNGFSYQPPSSDKWQSFSAVKVPTLPDFAAGMRAAYSRSDIQNVSYQPEDKRQRELNYYYQLEKNPDEMMMRKQIGSKDASSFRFSYDPEHDHPGTFEGARNTGAGLLLYDQGVGDKKWGSDKAQIKKYGDDWMTKRLYKNIEQANKEGVSGDRLNIEIDNANLYKGGNQADLYRKAIDGMIERNLSGKFIFKNPAGMKDEELKSIAAMMKDKKYSPYLAGVAMQELEGLTREERARVEKHLGKDFPTITSPDTNNYGTRPRKGAEVEPQTVRVGEISRQQEARVIQGQLDTNAIRNQELNPKLEKVLSYAAGQIGAHVEVYSGGQSGYRRIGSTRHDNGNAADLKLFVMEGGQKRYLDFNNAEDREKYATFVEHARAAGATGIGAGEGYMGSKAIHVGYGDEMTWGTGGRSVNTPGWLRQAFERGREMAKDFKFPEKVAAATSKLKGKDALVSALDAEPDNPVAVMLGKRRRDPAPEDKRAERREPKIEQQPAADLYPPPPPEPSSEPQSVGRFARDIRSATTVPPADSEKSVSTLIEAPVNNPEKEDASPSSNGYGQTHEFD